MLETFILYFIFYFLFSYHLPSSNFFSKIEVKQDALEVIKASIRMLFGILLVQLLALLILIITFSFKNDFALSQIIIIDQVKFSLKLCIAFYALVVSFCLRHSRIFVVILFLIALIPNTDMILYIWRLVAMIRLTQATFLLHGKLSRG